MIKKLIFKIFILVFLGIFILFAAPIINAESSIGNPDKRYAAPGENFSIIVEAQNNESKAVDNVISEISFNSCISKDKETQIICKSVEGGSCQGNKAIRNFGTLKPNELGSARVDLAFAPSAIPGKEAIACSWKITGIQNGSPVEILKPWDNVVIFVQVAQSKASAKPTTSPITITLKPENELEIIQISPSPTLSELPEITSSLAIPASENKPIINVSNTLFAGIIIICCIILIALIAGIISLVLYYRRKKD